VSMNEIGLEGIVSNLLCIGIDSEIQRVGVWVEGEETDVTLCLGLRRLISNSPYNLQCFLIYSVECA
jgi:hypothetical protein